jgi:hypothetical protein
MTSRGDPHRRPCSPLKSAHSAAVRFHKAGNGVGREKKEDQTMTNAARTQEPWTYQYSPYTSQDGQEIPAFEVYEWEKICDTNENRPIEEQEANAGLIAAAPELLAAAKKVVRRWKKGDLAEAVRELAAAIATAKGRAP